MKRFVRCKLQKNLLTYLHVLQGRDSSQIAFIEINDRVLSLVQAFLPPVIATVSDDSTSQTDPIVTPNAIRACAFVTIGKICLRNQVCT